MSSRLSRQPSATPSLQLTTYRESLALPHSITPSLTTSPTSSVTDSLPATEFSSFSQSDDYAAMQSSSVAPADVKANIGFDGLDGSNEHENRRSSARARKPTSKAQQLESTTFFSRRRSSTTAREPSPPADDSPAVPEVDGSEANAQSDSSGSVTPPNTISVARPAAHPDHVNGEQALPSKSGQSAATDETALNDAAPSVKSPSRRTSRRERKPTAKVISADDSPSPAKRAAPAGEELQPRKSLRLSYNGPKIPSRLRYSISSSRDNSEEAVGGTPSNHDQVLMIDVEPPAKSLIVTLKYKRASESLAPSPSAATRKQVTRRGKKKSTTRKSQEIQSTSATVESSMPENGTTCDLGCLDPAEKLYVMAQIAMMMPDPEDEDENESVLPGSANDYRSYLHKFCKCHELGASCTQRTTSLELEQARAPHTIANDHRLGEAASVAHDAEFLAAPVNKILRKPEAEKVSHLFNSIVCDNPPLVDASRSWSRTQTSKSAPPPPHSGFAGPRRSTGSMPPPMPTKKSFEERMKMDHLALSEARKRASAKGIGWSYNMALGDIEELLAQRAQQEQTVPPPHAPSNQKGSRYRVDLRGLRGESPGGGTIIMGGRS